MKVCKSSEQFTRKTRKVEQGNGGMKTATHLSWWQTPASFWRDQSHRALPDMEWGQLATRSYSSDLWNGMETVTL